MVDKAKLAASGDYNLSGERYREGAAQNTEYPIVHLNEVCSINPETADPSSISDPTFNYIDISCVENGSGQFLGASEIECSDAPSRARRSVKDNDILLGTVRPNLKAFCLLKTAPPKAIASTGFAVLRAKPDVLTNAFLIHLLRHEKTVSQMIGMMDKGAYPSINQTDIASLKIPLPPLAIQQAIVAEIERYQTIIDGARAVVDNYQPQIDIDPSWDIVLLDSVSDSISDGDHMPPPKALTGIPFITISNISQDNQIDFTKTHFVDDVYFSNLKPHRKPQKNDILYTVTGSYGVPVFIEDNTQFCFQRHIGLIRPASSIDEQFLYFLFKTDHIIKQGHAAATGVAQKTVSLTSLRNFKIPLPPLATQQAIVAQIQAEQALVNANRELITRFEAKIAATLARVWGVSTGEVV